MTLRLTLKAAKSNFFDREAVQKAADRATVRNLSKFGAFVWRRSRSSIRKRKRISNPGSPPSSHTGLLKDLIFFAYDQSSRSVVIGPTLLNNSTGEAPAALERGGTSTIISSNRRKKRTRRITVKARPYMRPAFDLVRTKELPDIWKDSVR